MKLAYDKGVQDACDAFGVRIASDMMRRRMPHGDPSIGAERLARALSGDGDQPTVGADNSSFKGHRRLDRPTRWGQRTSVDGGEFQRGDYGLGQFGGV